ncbi:MAG: TRAP transporter small permease [Pseudomonadota bacterium]
MASLERLYLRILGLMAGIAAAIFAGIAIAIPVNVLLRNAFSTGIPGVLDGVEYGLLDATFLAAPWVLARDAHVSVDIFIAAFGRLRPKIDRMVNLLGAVLALIFLYYSLEATLISAARGSMVRQTLVFPEWWALAVMPFSMAFITIEFLRRAIRRSDHEQLIGL